jgi:hypothetical protein
LISRVAGSVGSNARTAGRAAAYRRETLAASGVATISKPCGTAYVEPLGAIIGFLL